MKVKCPECKYEIEIDLDSKTKRRITIMNRQIVHPNCLLKRPIPEILRSIEEGKLHEVP